MAGSDLPFDFWIIVFSLGFSLLGGCEKQFCHVSIIYPSHHRHHRLHVHMADHLEIWKCQCEGQDGGNSS